MKAELNLFNSHFFNINIYEIFDVSTNFMTAYEK